METTKNLRTFEYRLYINNDLAYSNSFEANIESVKNEDVMPIIKKYAKDDKVLAEYLKDYDFKLTNIHNNILGVNIVIGDIFNFRLMPKTIKDRKEYDMVDDILKSSLHGIF